MSSVIKSVFAIWLLAFSVEASRLPVREEALQTVEKATMKLRTPPRKKIRPFSQVSVSSLSQQEDEPNPLEQNKVLQPVHPPNQRGAPSPDEESGVSSTRLTQQEQSHDRSEGSAVSALILTPHHQKLVAWFVIILGLGAVMMTACHLHCTASMDVQIGALAALFYLVMAVTIDVLVQSSRKEKQKSPFLFDPACVMIVVELGKLVISVGLFAGAKSQSGKPWQSMTEAVGAFTLRDVGLLACPALVFFANNMLMFFANGYNDLSSFGAFRETLILWTAILWTFTFQVSLGRKRIYALFTLLVGLVLNQVMPLLQASFHPAAIGLVCLMSFANAAGSVCFEWVVKQQSALDLNLQNIVLYFWGSVLGFFYLAMWDAGKLVGIKNFFFGFTVTVAMIVCAQMFAGLFISRMLKYANSVTRAVVASLRGPVLVFLAPVLGISSNFDGLTITSSVIVASSALYFLLQGRPEAPKVPDAAKQSEAEIMAKQPDAESIKAAKF